MIGLHTRVTPAGAIARALPAALVVAVCLCGAPTHAASDAVRTVTKDAWIEVRTENFTILSNARGPKIRKLAVDLERFRDALGRVTRGFELDARVPTTIFVFRNETTYRPYKRDADGELMNVGGYFQPTPFGNFVTLDLSADSRSMSIVYHEYLHAVMATTIGDLPVWLNEGLAEYFSTFDFVENSLTVEVGHPIEGHLRFIARHGMIDWNDVYTTTTDSPTYNEGTRQGAFYAQSWLAVHYLMATDQRVGSFGRLLALLREGQSTNEAVEEALGMDLPTLAARIDEYSQTGSGHVWWSLGEEARPVEVETRDVAEAEILFELGNLLAHRAQKKEAARHLDAAGAAGHPAGPIETALGYAAYARDDHDRAEKRFRAAIKAGVRSPEPYVLLAEIVLDRDRWEHPDANRAAKELGDGTLEARRLAQSALEVDDGNFHALVTLADRYRRE